MPKVIVHTLLDFHLRLYNSVFDETDHPIWGAIIGVFPLVEIKAGMELFMYYDYERSDFPQDFPWYWETKLAIEREERIDKEKNSKKGKQKKIKKGQKCQT